MVVLRAKLAHCLRHPLVWASLVATSLPALGFAEVQVIDDARQVLTLSKPAQRIVSLAPHATELLFAVGAGAQVIGSDEYSDFPTAARRIPRIGRAGALDLERIVSLRPDLVIGWGSGNSSAQVGQLQRLGLKVFVSEPRQLEDVASSLRRLGQLSGHATQGNAVATKFDQEIAHLRQRYGNKKPVTVFYEIWNQPLMTINGQHIISAVIELCGGKNVFAKLGQIAPTVDVEAVLNAQPQAILGSGSDATRPEWLDDWRRWPRIPAAANGHLYHIPPDLIQRHTPRLLEGATQVCEAIERARAPQKGAKATR
jgi:iron complex transport system substrate-binding protein